MPATPFVVKTTSPCAAEDSDDAETNDVAEKSILEAAIAADAFTSASTITPDPMDETPPAVIVTSPLI